MKQMEKELSPNTGCQQQKCLLPGEWDHCACVCTHQHALKLCFNFQSSSTATCSYALVFLMTGRLTRSSEEWWFTYGVSTLTRILLEWKDWKIDLFHFLNLVCRGHCETLPECLCFKYMLHCSWRTKSQPAVWHSWREKKPNKQQNKTNKNPTK